jgi:hypothetical protein
MERSSETDGSGEGTGEDPPGPSPDDSDAPEHRMVQAGAGADVPINGSEEDGEGRDDPDQSDGAGGDGGEDGDDGSAVAEPDGGADSVSSAADAPPSEDAVRDAATEERESESDSNGPSGGARTDDSRSDDATAGDDAADREANRTELESADDDAEGGGSESPDVPEELRELLADAASDDGGGDDGETDGSTTAEASVNDGAERATSRSAPEESYAVEEHRPSEPTDLAKPDPDGGGMPTTETEETDEPAAEAEPVSVRSEMSPALAERQAFVSLLLALGGGTLVATVGNVLSLSRWQTVMALVSAGIVVLLIATFVVFRAMLAAAERNDEPYSSAYTHPLFMFLFVLTTTVTALFVGYVSRLVT